ncbi:MAG: NosD domain-containing protein [Candidatus Bathyarchaeia archaeon]
MSGRIVAGIVVSFLLMGCLALALSIQPVKASGTVYIRADGSIDPPSAPISTFDYVTYTLTGNVTSDADGIVVEKDSIVVDGAGYTVRGVRNGNGITLTERVNVTLGNMTIENFGYGIQLSSSSSNVLSGNNVTANQWGGIFLAFSSFNNNLSGNNVAGSDHGVYLSNSSKNTLFGNNITYNGDGITLNFDSSDNVLFGNNVTANRWDGIVLGSSSDHNVLSDNNALNNGYGANVGYGISLWASSNNTLSGNVMEGNRYNFGVDGYALSHYLHSIDASNLVNGKPVYYFVNQSDMMVSADSYPEIGYLGLVDCANVTARGLNLTSNAQGILVAFTNDSKITGNNVANNAYGIVLGSSFDNILSGNNVTSSQMFGIVLGSSQGYPDFSSNSNILSGNNIAGTHYYFGIWLISSSNNTLVGNNVTANFQDGIRLSYSSNNNTLLGNNATANNRGGIYLDSSSGNSIVGNNIENNDYAGIELISSSGNSLFHNNIINNINGTVTVASWVNTWDNGYPSGGNYWSDHNGTDVCSGPHQNETGSDGIGDLTYIIDANNTDNYPLMGMFSSFNASLGYSVDVVSNSTIEDLAYFESNSTVTLRVSNMTVGQTNGFCRLTIPHGLLSPPYTITINGTQVSYAPIFENETLSIIYFSYEHSKLEIIIIPEFPSLLILPLVFIATLLAVIVCRRKQAQRE